MPGMIALVALISPAFSRATATWPGGGSTHPGEFIESVRGRDRTGSNRRAVAIAKGLYARRRARAGELPNFTGVDSGHTSRPQAPEITIDTWNMSAEAACECIVTYLQQHRYL